MATVDGVGLPLLLRLHVIDIFLYYFSATDRYCHHFPYSKALPYLQSVPGFSNLQQSLQTYVVPETVYRRESVTTSSWRLIFLTSLTASASTSRWNWFYKTLVLPSWGEWSEPSTVLAEWGRQADHDPSVASAVGTRGSSVDTRPLWARSSHHGSQLLSKQTSSSLGALILCPITVLQHTWKQRSRWLLASMPDQAQHRQSTPSSHEL